MTAQWWLVELNEYDGVQTLLDGPHVERAGVDNAAYLYERLGFAKGKRLAVAHVTLTATAPRAEGVDQEALSMLNARGLKP